MLTTREYFQFQSRSNHSSRCRVGTWLVACGPLGYSAALCSTYLAELSTLQR